MKRIVLSATAMLVFGVGAVLLSDQGVKADPPPRGDAVIYVTGQGLYYDSVVNGPLPPHGPFQLLEMGPNGLQTEYGPGDPGYLGGRWMADMDGDGTYEHFSCPLLPPGREEP